jgi:hypothetical protein
MANIFSRWDRMADTHQPQKRRNRERSYSRVAVRASARVLLHDHRIDSGSVDTITSPSSTLSISSVLSMGEDASEVGIICLPRCPPSAKPRVETALSFRLKLHHGDSGVICRIIFRCVSVDAGRPGAIEQPGFSQKPARLPSPTLIHCLAEGSLALARIGLSTRLGQLG